MARTPSGDNLLLGNYDVYFAELDANGLPLGQRHVGNVSAASIGITPDVLEKKERMTSARGTYKKVTRSTDVVLKLTLDEIVPENLVAALFGTQVAFGQASGTLTDAVVTSSSVQGLWYNVGKRALSGITVKDDTVSRTLNTDYRVDVDTGRVYIVPGGAIVNGSEITISCSHAAVSSNVVRALTDTEVNRYVFLKGDPTTGATHDYEFWNVAFVPDGELALITDEFATIQLNGGVQADTTNHASEPYFRVIERVAG